MVLILALVHTAPVVGTVCGVGDTDSAQEVQSWQLLTALNPFMLVEH